MPSFGSRRKRSTRVIPLKVGQSFWTRLTEPFANRSLWLRLGMCAAAIAIIVICVEAWKPPFPYRIGDYVDHGIMARIDFRREDRFKSEQAQSIAEARSPQIYLHDPEPLNLLPAKLRTSLREIADAKALSDVSPKTRLMFGLTAQPAGPSSEVRAVPLESEFKTLQSTITDKPETPGNRIDDVVAEFEKFVAPLKTRGLVDVNEFTTNPIGSERSLAIVSGPSRAPQQVVTAEDVQLAELLKETGALGKSWLQFPRLVANKRMFERWLVSEAPVTLRYDGARSLRLRREARDRTPPVTVDYSRNQMLVSARQHIDDTRLALLRTEYDEVNGRVESSRKVFRVLTVTVMLLILAVLNGLYLSYNEPQMIRHSGKLFVYLTLIVATIALGRTLSLDPWRAELVPFTVTVMVLAIVYGQELAILTVMTLALILTASTSGSVAELVMLVTVAVTAIAPLGRIASRSRLVKVGFQSALACFLVSWGFGFLNGDALAASWLEPEAELLKSSARSAGWVLVAGYLVAGSLPFIEHAFGVVTNISLLEMSDISHPLLRELVRLAPGTYNHSIAVATIGETAAERIGANGLLVRVGAYYHDIGKMLKPHYFVENVTGGGESRHVHLAPAMSTLIIIGHVKDGVDLARQFNLPQTLIDFIEQHHGTTLVEYFYREATRIADRQPDQRGSVEESSFRYPGPKPQTREAGVLMLADAVESASRALSDTTPKRIETLVHELTMKRLLDGQFDECSLTLAEIHAIEESLSKSLIGIYHARIKYPEQRTA